MAEENDWDGDDPNIPNDPDEIAYFKKVVVIHEIGHQFALRHDMGGFPNNSVMAAPSGDADEPQMPNIPTTFKDEDIIKIRDIADPSKNNGRGP